jgi:aminoglycoside phosphotransferase (APT) family kinase protein
MIAGDLLRFVPGCEDGDPPYSQELIGGGRVNRCYLVRTRRGRFVVRLNDNSASDPGLDRDRELALHSAAAAAGIAPPVIHAAADRSSLITEYLDGRIWTPHYFSRMRDLRAIGQRLRTLHALAPPSIPRYDPMVTARRYAEGIVRHDGDADGRIASLLAGGTAALTRSGWGSRAAAIVHGDLHHGNVLTADRIYFIDWEYAQVADPMHDLACIVAYYPRAAAHGSLLLEAAGLDASGATPAKLTDLTHVFLLENYLRYRARRLGRSVPATDLQLESAALRRLLPLAPDAQPRHTSAANLREISGVGNGNGDVAGD